MTRRDALIRVIEALHREIAALKSNDVVALERATTEKLAAIEDVASLGTGPAGPDLREIVLGSEGRLGVLTDVKVRVTRQPEAEEFHVFFLPGWEKASTAIRELAQRRLPLSMLRLSNAQPSMSLRRTSSVQ